MIRRAVAASAPLRIVAGEQLAVAAARRDPDAVMLAWNRRHVEEHCGMPSAVPAEVRHHRVGAVGDVDPREPFPARILAPERRLLTVDVPEAAHVLVERGAIGLLLDQMPVQAPLVI